MFVQLKTGHDIDRGPAWISVVSFSRSWRTATWHGRRLRRTTGLFDANFVDEETGDWYWLSGPRRDLGDTRNARVVPTVDDDAAQPYREFLDGATARPGAGLKVRLAWSIRWCAGSRGGAAGAPPAGSCGPSRPAL